MEFEYVIYTVDGGFFLLAQLESKYIDHLNASIKWLKYKSEMWR